jgi:hypothetical protein
MKFICRIGTNPGNDLVLNDRTAADFHAQLMMGNDNKVFVRNLETRYGTRVNGSKIDKIELFAGDSLRIGFVSIDWEKIVNEWMLLNPEALNEEGFAASDNREFAGVQNERLSFKLAAEAGKVRPEYYPGETGKSKHSQENDQSPENPKETSLNPETPVVFEFSQTKETVNKKEEFIELEKQTTDTINTVSAQTEPVPEQVHVNLPSSNNHSKPIEPKVYVVANTHISVGDIKPPKNKIRYWFMPFLAIFSGVLVLLLLGWILAWVSR